MDTLRQLFKIFLIYLLAKIYAEGLSTLSAGRRIAEGVPYSLVCTESSVITENVLFFKDNVNQGGCVFTTCDSSKPEYSVTQNATSTTLHIDSVNGTREAGSWTCQHGTDPESSPVVIALPIPDNILPSNIVVKPTLNTTLTSLDGITNITASLPCATDTPDFRWSYTQGSSKITVTGTDDSEQGACSTGEKIYSSTLLISTLQAAGVSGTIVLQLEVEYDSFDPPTYTETFSSGNIVFGVPDCIFCLIIIIIALVLLVLLLIIYHLVIFFVKVSFLVMGILFFVNAFLAVVAVAIGIVVCVLYAEVVELILAIIAIVIGFLTNLYKLFFSKHVLKKADVPHRHLFGGFCAYPWKTGDASGDDPDAPTNTPATVETIRESSSGNSRVTRNQETVLLTNKTTNSQETDERKDGNKATPAEYGNMNMNIPALGLQSNQGKAQTGDGNGGQTGNETSKSEKGEKKKGSKKKKSKKKKEKQDGSQSPPAVSVSGVAVDDPKMVAEPEEQIRSDPNLTKVVG